MIINGIFFQSFKGRKIVRVETDGELFTVKFSDGETLKVNLNQLNHILVTATGR